MPQGLHRGRAAIATGARCTVAGGRSAGTGAGLDRLPDAAALRSPYESPSQAAVREPRAGG
jgi:hypothetical protein